MRHFDAEATRAGLPLPALIEALRRAFAGDTVVPPRHVHAIGDAGTMLLMPAWRQGARLGLKTVNVFPGNASSGLSALHATYTLYDASSGVPLAQLDGSEITTRRTVAASALAASYLARADAATLLVVGAGRLAREMPLAMRVVRPTIRRVLVWNHRPQGAQRLAAELRGQGLAAEAVDELRRAVAQADIVSCLTLSHVPLVRGGWLAEGTHLDLVGAFTPDMRECDGDCLRRARVWVDTEEALAKAGDLTQAIVEGAFDPARLQGTLATMCRGTAPGRRDRHEITLFKSVGTALEDLAAAELVCDGPPR